MGKKQAVILDMDKRTATVLQPDGSFSKVPRRAGMSVGDMVHLPTGRRRPWMSVAVAAAMVLVMLYTSLIVLPANKVMAYVTVDSAPGVELAVNGRGKVISSAAVNADGERLLASVSEPKGSLAEAIARLTDAAVAEGYVPEEDEVVVVTVAPAHNGVRNGVLAKIERVADQAVQQVLTKKQSKAKIERIKLTPEVREEAKKEGISAGHYAIALKAADKGIDLTLDELRAENVVQVLKRKGAQPSRVIKETKEEKSLNSLMERNRGKLKAKKNAGQVPEAGISPDSDPGQTAPGSDPPEQSPTGTKDSGQQGPGGPRLGPGGRKGR